MRRTVLLVVAWLACGAAAVGAASLGVSRVADQVTDDRPTPLSAAEVRDELAAGATTTTPAAPSTTTAVATTTTTAGTGTIPTTPAASPTSVVPPTSAATTAPATAPETRTYSLLGGTATLRFTSAGVTVVVATPNPGFSVETSPERGNGIRVEFDGDEHRSRVTGWWEDGPREEVREED